MDMSNIFTYFVTLIFGAMIAMGVFCLGIIALDKQINQIDFWAELKNKNMAVAVFLGCMLIALAIVLSAAG